MICLLWISTIVDFHKGLAKRQFASSVGEHGPYYHQCGVKERDFVWLAGVSATEFGSIFAK
jgi:hypothetical protein